MGRLKRAVLPAFALALAGCSSGGGGGGAAAPAAAPPPDDCSATAQKQFVDDVMRDIYLWQSELPAVDLADFDSPEALLEALLFTPLDRFSDIRDEQTETAFFSDSQFIGIGLGTRIVGDELFVTQAFADGPAAAAGLDRGYRLLRINGAAVATLLDGGGLDGAFGPDEIGVEVVLEYADLAGAVATAQLFKRLVTIETVSAVAVLDAGGVPTGYVAFRNFVQPSFAALEGAFADLRAAGVQDLVLDLRYNGGGLVSVADFLANLLGGEVTAGDVFSRRVHNENNTALDTTTLFADEAEALDLRRVVIITTGATASASELVINGLVPFVDVTLVGEPSFGKPVGAYGYGFCSKILRPTSFASENALGEGDYFDGFAVDCQAVDDLGHALGDPLEASLAEALHYLANGSCSVTASTRKARLSAVASKHRAWQRARTPWRTLLGAH